MPKYIQFEIKGTVAHCSNAEASDMNKQSPTSTKMVNSTQRHSAEQDMTSLTETDNLQGDHMQYW